MKWKQNLIFVVDVVCTNTNMARVQPYMGQKCSKCNLLNHFSKACRSKLQIHQTESNNVESNTSKVDFNIGTIY